VQQLPAVEGLARVDVICLDKTGTLTEGKIILDELITLEPDLKSRIEQVLAAFATAPNSPTLQALQDAFPGPPALKATYTVPFSSARKWSALKLTDNEYWIMGAPEMVLPGDQKDLNEQIKSIAATGSVFWFCSRVFRRRAPRDYRAIGDQWR
jgi:cation-transporting ATPase E